MLYALPALLVKQSTYYRELLKGEFLEAMNVDADTSTHEGGGNADAAPQAESDGRLLEDWQAYFSDSDASFYESDEDDDDEEEQITQSNASGSAGAEVPKEPSSEKGVVSQAPAAREFSVYG